METGFDKEMDVLLRTASAGRNVGEGGERIPHLEVDAIAGYAENVLPPLIRKKYSEHFADCARCRQILGNLIAMNAAAATEAAVPVAGRIETPQPRRFFFIPPPVYALSALLVIFGGFLLYSALQVPLSGPPEISSFSEPELPRLPANDQEASASNRAALDSSSPSAANAAPPKTPAAENGADMDAVHPAPLQGRKEKNERLLASKDPTPQPPVSTTETAVGNADVENAELPIRTRQTQVGAEKPRAEAQVAKSDESKVSAGKVPEELGKLAAPPAPSKTDYEANDRAAEMRKKRSDESAVLDGADTTEARSRTIGGKTFENRNGVWFDSGYKGQDAADIRRETNAYRRLDAGLRAIADELKGTVIVVWKKKAYRIN